VTWAVGYCRVSTTGQADDGHSLGEQEARIRAYCGRRGWDVAVLRDAGISAAVPLAQRPAGAQLPGPATHVVAVRLDRLFRSTRDAVMTLDAWRGRVDLHLLEFGGGELDTSTPMGRMYFTLAAAFAELERGLISERTKAGHRGALREGRIPGGRRPYGFRAGPGRAAVPVPEEVATVRLMLRWRDAGLPWGEIATELNERGTPTAGGRRGPGAWRGHVVRRIVERYADPLWAALLDAAP